MSPLEAHTADPLELRGKEEVVGQWPHMIDESLHMEMQNKLMKAFALTQGWKVDSSGMNDSDEAAFAHWMFDENNRREKLRVMIRRAYGNPEALRDLPLKKQLDAFIASANSEDDLSEHLESDSETKPENLKTPSMSAKEFEDLLDEKGVEEKKR